MSEDCSFDFPGARMGVVLISINVMPYKPYILRCRCKCRNKSIDETANKELVSTTCCILDKNGSLKRWRVSCKANNDLQHFFRDSNCFVSS